MIKINLDKAKEISHFYRRWKRSDEFAPLDKIIAAQIPGKSSEEAEAQRVAIREKHAQIQIDIDAADNIDTLSQIVDPLKPPV